MKKQRLAKLAAVGPAGLRTMLDTFAVRTRRSRSGAIVYLLEKALAQEPIVKPMTRPEPPAAEAPTTTL